MTKKTYTAPVTEMIAVAAQGDLLQASVKETQEDNWAEGKENFIESNDDKPGTYNAWDNWDED